MQQSLLFLTSLLLWTASEVTGTPVPQSNTGTTSCDSDPLTVDTWTSLKIDDFLKNNAANLTKSTTNNVQSLADSFGAPNFFCGIDQFCNAGQPCTPVQLPAWYALVAVQNWNSYMNSVNTAITFASSIIGQTLPQIVADVYKDPEDNVTPLNNIIRAITTVAGVVPFTSDIAKLTRDTLTKTTTYSVGLIKPPAVADKFLAWTDVSSSIAGVIQDYQSAVTTSLKAVLDAPVNAKGGINEQLQGGRFLGVSQNFTQTELQDKMIDSLKVYSIGLALQAQKIFVMRFSNVADTCREDASSPGVVCQKDSTGALNRYILAKTDRQDNINPQNDLAKTLLDKYGFTAQTLMVNPATCFDQNGKKQVTDTFGASLPLESDALCLFNVAVCDGTGEDTIENCRKAGANI
ncbi:hypothetical protein DL95DRAFT_500748 [Leptodontidium sp. 2 PMI_412]|nr:hypothetical protein DL95DRAFT_500748 [Leptodontidium sp. 2 PMI_412]